MSPGVHCQDQYPGTLSPLACHCNSFENRITLDSFCGYTIFNYQWFGQRMIGYQFNSHPVHDDVIKWKHFARYWPFVLGIHLSPVNSPHKGQWRGALMFSFICAGINGWVNNDKADDLRRRHVHYYVTVMDGRGDIFHYWHSVRRIFQPHVTRHTEDQQCRAVIFPLMWA